MLILALFLGAALIMTAIEYNTRESALGWPAAGVWALMTVQSYILSEGVILSVYYGLFLFGIAMVVFSILSVWSLHGKKDDRIGGKDSTNPEDREMTSEGVEHAEGSHSVESKQQQPTYSRSQGVRDRAVQRRAAVNTSKTRVRW